MAEGPPAGPVSGVPVRPLLAPLGTSAAGMLRQQQFLEIIARNIANAETTRTEDGGPYRRQIGVISGDPRTPNAGVSVVEDVRAGRRIHDPGHPDADSEGMVTLPNVDLAMEVVDLMLARRLHEANAAAFQAAKAMLRRAMEI